jgi:ParB family chromosome partitioning protein
MVTATQAVTRAAPAATGAAVPRPRRESLADVLRRRSTSGPTESRERAAAVQQSLSVLTRGAEGTLADVPLDELHANPYQPRFQFNRQPLQELAQSLATEGQLEPAIARRVFRDGREVLEVVAGARRLEAAKICNATIRPFPTLKVDVRNLTDEEAERISLIENLQRENLTPLEEGYRYWQLQQRDPRRWSVRAIAEFVHKKKSSVQNRLGLIKDPAVAEAVLREQITPTAGFHVLRLPPSERPGYLRVAVAERLTVEQIKADVDRRLAPPPDTTEGATDQTRGTAIDLGAPAENERRPDASPRVTEVRAHVRTTSPSVTKGVSQERRAQLQALWDQTRERIEALEAQLRAELRGLRAIERELGAVPE